MRVLPAGALLRIPQHPANFSAPPRNATADDDPLLAAGRRLVDAPHQRCVVPPGALLALAEPAVDADDADACHRSDRCRLQECGADGRPPPPLVSAPLNSSAAAGGATGVLWSGGGNNKPRVSVLLRVGRATSSAALRRAFASLAAQDGAAHASVLVVGDEPLCAATPRAGALRAFLLGASPAAVRYAELSRAPPPAFSPRTLALWRAHGAAAPLRLVADAPAATERAARLLPRRPRATSCRRQPRLGRPRHPAEERARPHCAWRFRRHDPARHHRAARRMRADPELEPPPIPWLAARRARRRAPPRARPARRAGATSCPEPAAAAAATTSVEAPVEEEETAEAAAEVSYWLGLLAGVSVCVVSPALGQSLADTPPPPPPPPWPELCPRRTVRRQYDDARGELGR